MADFKMADVLKVSDGARIRLYPRPSQATLVIAQSEWCAAKHGCARRRWMKLHLGVDATTGEIAAHVLTDAHADDAAQVPDLSAKWVAILAA